MGRFQGDLPIRTPQFASSILKIVDRLPHGYKTLEIARQLVRCGTSIGANVHEADQAFTPSDFAHKCSIARKEAAETFYWLCVCRDSDLIDGTDVDALTKDADEFVRILSTVIKRTKRPPGSP